jgi:hypothetical protein
MQMTVGGWGWSQDCSRRCVESPRPREKRAPVSTAQCGTLVPVSIVLCWVVRWVRGAWVDAACAVRQRAAPSLARWCAAAEGERHRAVASSTRFLSSYIHILCTRGCSILVDQTSNTRGHLRPPPSWWCVRPCAFVSSRLSQLTTSPVRLFASQSHHSRCASTTTAFRFDLHDLYHTQRYPSSIHFMI